MASQRNRKNHPACVLSFLLAGALSLQAHAQSCCGSAGTFLGGVERGGLRAGTLTAAAVYNFTAFERTLDGTRRIADPSGRRAVAHALNLEVEFAPIERLSILAVLPFTDKSRTVSITTGDSTITQRYHAAGVSDAFALVKYSLLLPTLSSPWSLAIGGGAKAPTGSSTVTSDGVVLPLDVQPGSSAWEALAWLFGSYRLDDPSLLASASVLVRKPGTNANGRTMGTDVQALLTLSTFELDIPLVPLLLTRVRWTDSDRIGDRVLPATGTFRIELLPAVVLTALDPWMLRLGAQLPIYERTNGVQLAPTWGVFAEVRTTTRLW